MLAFNLLGGGASDRKKLKAFTSAISKTIELSCNVKHTGIPAGPRPVYRPITEGSEIYRRFWKAIFEWHRRGNNIPTIITFNYDLVLERALLQVLTNTIYNRYDNHLPFKRISLDYQYKHFPKQYYQVAYTTYTGMEIKEGSRLEFAESEDVNNSVNIELLKLHGSLNFPSRKSDNCKERPSITNVIEDPYILPPVSNKQSNGSGNQSWKTALQRLREAKNVTFVGYSLPRTDMYMQFFLKAALGPNQELNRLFVFDPALWRNNDQSLDMKKRYEMCFSEQLRSRIVFGPNLMRSSQSSFAGTTAHFVSLLESDPGSILF